MAWHLRHEYLFGSVGDDHHLLIWDLRSRNQQPVEKVVAHQGEVCAYFYFPALKKVFTLFFSFPKVYIYMLISMFA